MSSNQNPYQSPNVVDESDVARIEPDLNQPVLNKSDRLGITIVMVTGAALAGIDYGFFAAQIFGLFTVFAPAVVFFVVVTWCYAASLRPKGFGIWRRVASGSLLAMFVTPICYMALVFTCTPATMVLGVEWRLYGGEYEWKTAIVGGLVIFVLVLAIAGLTRQLAGFEEAKRTKP